MLPEKMTMTKNDENKIGQKTKWPTILLFVIFLLTAAAAIYVSIYYRADETAWRYMQSDTTVTVLDTEYGRLFDGPSDWPASTAMQHQQSLMPIIIQSGLSADIPLEDSWLRIMLQIMPVISRA